MPQGQGSVDRTDLNTITLRGRRFSGKQHFNPIKKFPNDGFINCMDFSKNAEAFITSSSTGVISAFCLENNNIKHSYKLDNKKYGCELAQFTHDPSQAIMASNKINDDIRYLSLMENKYLMYFKGHEAKVISLHISPIEDRFVSGSVDKTVRIWDMRYAKCVALLNVPTGAPMVSFNRDGLIFAVVTSYGDIRLYDSRKPSNGPFALFNLSDDSQLPSDQAVKSIQFSPCGRKMLLTSHLSTLILDSYSGNKDLYLQFPDMRPYKESICSSFSSNGKRLLITTPNGYVNVHDVVDGQEVNRLPSSKGVHWILSSFKYQMFVTATTSNIEFWLPRPE